MTGLTRPPLVSQPELDRVVPECPYVGLVPFRESDAPYFFGRQRDCEVVVANLTTARLTLLYAGSGVGKSSVLRAGVLPRLQQIARECYEDLDEPDAAVAYIREWSPDPLVTIAAKVLSAVSRVPGASPVEVPSLPRLSVPWLREVIQRSRVTAIYLILDQFEEYFRYHPGDLGEDGLAGELGRILSVRDLQVNVLLSIREEELAALDRFKGRVPRLYDNYLRLAHLGRDAAREAIERPLDHYNQVAPPGSRMTIEPELTDALLDQVRSGLAMVPEGAAPFGPSPGGENIATPYLQLVLIRLWEHEWAGGSSVLRLSTLAELGGAEKIVQTHLGTVMDELPREQREVAAKVFHFLVTLTGAKKAQTAETLAEWSNVRVESVRELLQSLSAGRQSILRPVPPPAGEVGPSFYEIFHDVIGPAVLEWRRSYVAQQKQDEAARRLTAERAQARAAAKTARRQLCLAWLAAGLATILLVASGVLATWKFFAERRQEYLTQAATALGYNPVESLKYAVDAYQVPLPWANDQVRSAVLTAASGPRSSVVAGPKPMMIGMKSTPDSRHVVAYDANGSVWVIGADGVVERKVSASGLRGTVSPNPRVVAVSPDASRVVLATDQGMVAVIDTVAGRHIGIEGGAGLPRAVAWIGSASDGLVLLVSESGVAATYSSDTGMRITSFSSGVSDAVALADGQHVVTSGEDDKRLRVWDARAGTKIAESPTLDPPAFKLMRYAQSVVSLSVVGLSIDAQPSIVVWNWQAGRDPVRREVAAFSGLRRIVVNESAGTVMIAHGKVVQTYKMVDGSPLGSLPPQADIVTDVTASPDGRWITTAGADGRVLVWFQGNRKSPTAHTYELLGHRGGVTQVSYLPDGKLLSLGIDGTVQRWELPEVSRFEQHVGGVVHMDLSRDGSWFATADDDGHAFVVDSHDLSRPPVATVDVGTPLRFVLFDPTEPHRIFTLGRHDAVPKAWSWGGDGKPERLRMRFDPPPLLAETYGRLVSLAISRDGKTVAGGDDRGTIHLWDATTGKLRADSQFRGAGPAYSLAFDPSGQLLAATDNDGIHFWSLSTAEPPPLLRHPHATGVSVSPSGKHLVSAAGDGTVKIWTCHSKPADGVEKVWTCDGKRPRELVAHGHPSSSPRLFEPEGGGGELLAVGLAGGLVEVWDVDSGVTVMLDRHHSASVNSIVFPPGDGSRLISASGDTTVAQFSCRACTDPDGVIQEAEKWVKANPEPQP